MHVCMGKGYLGVGWGVSVCVCDCVHVWSTLTRKLFNMTLSLSKTARVQGSVSSPVIDAKWLLVLFDKLNSVTNGVHGYSWNLSMQNSKINSHDNYYNFSINE